jgi:hypothetical protein
VFVVVGFAGVALLSVLPLVKVSLKNVAPLAASKPLARNNARGNLGSDE